MGQMNDVYAVARIRVKEKYLLSDADVNQIVGLKDVPAVMAFLSDRGWGDTAKSQDPDSVLTAEEEKAMALLMELGIDKSVFEVLDYPNLFHNLKTAIKEICTEESHPEAFYDNTAVKSEEMKRIIREKAYGDLPRNMQKAAEEAYEAMLVHRDGQRCDMIVDRACLDAMEAVAKSSEHQILRDYEESAVAVADIRMAIRSARCGKSLNFLKEALAPCQSFDVGRMALAAAESPETLLNFLTENGYGEAAEALKQSDTAFERWCDNRIIRSIQCQKRNSFTLGPIVAYYLARKNEIKTVRIILTAKANDLPEEAIRERIREMYV